MSEPAPIVLVIDDEVQIRRFLRAGLELDGFVVEDAETGADALKSVTLKQPDLVILDLGLPDMDGGDVLERLRTYYRTARGEHPDWADYDRAMVQEQRLIIEIEPARAYGFGS